MPKTLRETMMDALARREHSRFELEKKYSASFSQQDIHSVLDSLEREGIQSDERFTQAYIRSRSNKGYGRKRIDYELRNKGIDTSLIDDQFKQADIDWHALAHQVFIKKFGEPSKQCKTDTALRAKQFRFMQYRGFDGYAQ